MRRLFLTKDIIRSVETVVPLQRSSSPSRYHLLPNLQNLLIKTSKRKRVWFNTTLVSLQNVFHQRVAERCSRQRGFSPTISSSASTRDSRLTETRLIFIESLPMFDPMLANVFQCLTQCLNVCQCLTQLSQVITIICSYPEPQVLVPIVPELLQ